MLTENQQRLRERFRAMLKASPEIEYYALTLTATDDGRLFWSAQSEFASYTDDSPHRELRKACHVHGQKMLDLWRDVGMPGLAVNTTSDLAIYLRFGGNAIVEDSLTDKYFPHILEERIVVPTGAIGTTPIELVDEQALRRAPTPKQRMKILKRDKYCCRICGRRPDDNVDVQLQVHHLRPWAMGGLTDESNLITLCHTCHDGLYPHYESSLLSIFPEAFQPFNELVSRLDSLSREYHAGVQAYRRIAQRITPQTTTVSNTA